MEKFTWRLLVFLCIIASTVPPLESALPPTLEELETHAPGAIEGDILPSTTGYEGYYSRELWPAAEDGSVTVPYTFGDSKIDQDKVTEAIHQWEDDTCIEFRRVDPGFNGHHLIFRNSYVCASKLGRDGASGQDILLHPSCVENVGQTTHQIGHALGFYHQHSRSDRDKFVRVVLNNVQEDKVPNFSIRNTTDYETPYDLFSIMHYGTRFFSKNGDPTIVPRDGLNLPLLGNRWRPSFWDIKLANLLYNCIDQWEDACSTSSNNSPCLNGGYVGQKCECVCPESIVGVRCEFQGIGREEFVRTVVLIRFFSINPFTGPFSTPEYPEPQQNKMAFIVAFAARKHERVKFTMEDFDLPERRGTGRCRDYLTIYFSEDLENQLTSCGSEILPGTEFLSEGNILLVEYINYKYPVDDPIDFRGFLATIRHIPENSRSGGNGTLMVNFQEGRCSLEPTEAPGIYLFQSPKYPERYGAFEGCVFQTSTDTPSYLRITPLEARLGFFDTVKASCQFAEFSLDVTGTEKIIPTSFVSVGFQSGLFGSGKFNLQIEVLYSDCHMEINLHVGATGDLTLPHSYAPDTICEWWIVAPEGKKVQMEVRHFEIGEESYSYFCWGKDILLVDEEGTGQYGGTSVKKFCGENGSQIFTSKENKLNILFYGKNSGMNSFKGSYSVI